MFQSSNTNQKNELLIYDFYVCGIEKLSSPLAVYRCTDSLKRVVIVLGTGSNASNNSVEVT